MYFEIIRLLGLVGTVACIISRIDVVGLWPVLFLKRKARHCQIFLNACLLSMGPIPNLSRSAFSKTSLGSPPGPPFTSPSKASLDSN